MANNTVNQNLIVPEVYAGLVREKIAGKIKVAQTAKVISDLKEQKGETINFPVWSYIGDAEDIAIGAEMGTAELEQTVTSATIKEVAAKGVPVYDYDNMVALGDALDEASKQQAIAIARKMDTDCINEALKSPLKQAIASEKEVTFEELNKALALYGDDANAEDFACIVIHSNFSTSFVTMDGFVARELTHTTDGNGVVVNNVLGYFRGIPVVVSDRCYDATKQESFILFIKKDSIGLIPKEEPFIELERNASKRCTTIYCSTFYAVALIDESGVVVARKTV